MEARKKSQSTEAESAQHHDRPPPEWQPLIDAYLEFRRVHRGVSDATLDDYRAVARQFVEYVVPARPKAIEPRHIDGFLLRGRSVGRERARRASSSFRVFLRYLAMLGHVPAALASQVSRPRTYRLAALPRALEESDLRRVLRSVRRRDPSGRAEYAILMVFATYGPRAGDVAALRLDDIRWREGSILIQVEKTGRPRSLPLAEPVEVRGEGRCARLLARSHARAPSFAPPHDRGAHAPCGRRAQRDRSLAWARADYDDRALLRPRRSRGEPQSDRGQSATGQADARTVAAAGGARLPREPVKQRLRIRR
jgi:hypothetical protein